VTVDPGSPTPAYLQLADILRGRIAAGEWSRGPLPSNRTLRETYEVGEYIVTRAVRVLEEEGLVFTVPRRGVYVRQRGLARADHPHVITQAPGVAGAGVRLTSPDYP
jgi:DNA-binding GntR family transcriptional regulator